MHKRIFVFSLFAALIDQIVKLLIISNLKLSESIVVINNFFYLSYLQNEGSAFNLLTVNKWFFVFLSLLALYVIIKYFIIDENITKMEALAYILIIGGIVGNLIDRLSYGYIIDYIDIFIGHYNYPVFNLADSFIVIGVIIVIWNLLKGNKK